jgi:hypothetical protein
MELADTGQREALLYFGHHRQQGMDIWLMPGQNSQHTGRPSSVKTAPTIIWRRSGRWSMENPNYPSAGGLSRDLGKRLLFSDSI